MKRRAFIENMFMLSAAIGAGIYLLPRFQLSNGRLDRRTIAQAMPVTPDDEGLASRLLRQSIKEAQLSPQIDMKEQEVVAALADVGAQPENLLPQPTDQQIVSIEEGLAQDDSEHKNAPIQQASSIQDKVREHEYTFVDDVVLDDKHYAVVLDLWERLNRIQKYVGHGHFNIISFDDALKFAQRVSEIGEVSAAEKDLLESLFYENPDYLGFYGERVVNNITDKIPSSQVDKIPGTGHYLFRGHSQEVYQRLLADVGDSIVLTSGVRSTIKQAELFLAKVIRAEGNMSKASRSLAPPGHSYHSIGDFDVGKIGYGLKNFSAEFAETEEFKRLSQLNYIKIRYTADNSVGVRYEPWHVRVV